MKSPARFAALSATAAACLFAAAAAPAATNVFFTGSQSATIVASNINAVTIQSGNYRFTFSRDGYFTGGVGLTNPVGRFFSVLWPNGIQAQAITAGPLVGNGATITIKRTDGGLFGWRSFTGKLLANTAATGADFELMPQLDGEDAFNNPLMFNASGYSGNSFPHIPALSGYDTYKINLFVDFALTALTLVDSDPVVPLATATNTVSATVSPAGAGTVTGAGGYPSNSLCTLAATANVGWRFMEWRQNGSMVATSAVHSFTVRSNSTLVAVFVSNAPPVAMGGTFFQLTNAPLTINITDLMWSDFDPEGGPVSFAAVSATSSNGLALSVDTNAMLIFVPASALDDSFTYTIVNTNGVTAIGTATIRAITSPAGRALPLDLGTPGGALAGFTGVPWYYYTVQRATNVMFTGTIQTWPVQAWADGSINIWDDFADLGSRPDTAFYRLERP